MSSAAATAHAAPKHKRHNHGNKHRGANRGGSDNQPFSSTAPAFIAPSPVASFAPSTVSAFAASGPKLQVSDVKFSSLADRVPGEILSNMPHEFLTPVQASTIVPALEGRDVLGLAKTGTGKTVAFLLPALTTLFKANMKMPQDVSILIVSPTRELAAQILTQTEMLLGQNSKFGAHMLIGGTNIGSEVSRLKSKRRDIIIATPGRLIDHMENTLKNSFTKLAVLVLDEADQMLDQGFKVPLNTILNNLPKRTGTPRQTLLFSATMPEEVSAMTDRALLPNYIEVNSISEADSNTHAHVNQSFIVAPFSQQDLLLLSLIRKHVDSNPSGAKIMVFYPTARMAGFAYSLFRQLEKRVPSFEIHSRLSQSKRTKTSDQYRASATGVLFSSDVSARGIDFPGVTQVYQMGIASSVEQYIHRLGRTGRAGAEGEGFLIIDSMEKGFAREVKKAVPALTEKDFADIEPTLNAGKATFDVSQALRQIDGELKAQAYVSFLGFYKGHCKAFKIRPEQLVQVANEYVTNSLGWNDSLPPAIQASVVSKMGLKGVSGINLMTKAAALGIQQSKDRNRPVKKARN